MPCTNFNENLLIPSLVRFHKSRCTLFTTIEVDRPDQHTDCGYCSEYFYFIVLNIPDQNPQCTAKQIAQIPTAAAQTRAPAALRKMNSAVGTELMPITKGATVRSPYKKRNASIRGVLNRSSSFWALFTRTFQVGRLERIAWLCQRPRKKKS